MKHRTGILSATLMAGGLALSAPAFAQQNSGGGEQQGAQQQQPISEEKLEKFANAYEDIREVRSEYVPKLQQAEGQEEQAQLQQEGQQEMVAAIQQNDMEVSEYQRIGRRLNNDEQLQERLKQIMQEQQPDSGNQQQ